MAYENECNEILSLFKIAGKEVPHEDSDTGRAVMLLQAICDAHSHTIPTPEHDEELSEEENQENAESEASDIFEALETLENQMDSDDDFHFEFDGNEYRIIKDDSIWDIYRDEIKNIVEDCYTDVIKLDKIPAFIAVSIDWEQTAQNAYVDGYGHTFSSYDGSEHQAGDWWIFRTN